ncbi:SUKH-3 domain-containing protein [Actinoplanes sp. RD1]|uniref:SUKH-3 domain-containing protein n=1 Tax=Actinoplanes sp. RD1 TaxID=3064538 RepID=UPI002740FF4C|nr:SUKH-3 domain-containing protein [Actinoplanes sp. RD1]
MIARTEAEARARTWLAQHDDPEPPLKVLEFEHGWVIRRDHSATGGMPPAPPPFPDTRQIVIDRDTEDLVPWLVAPTPLVAAQYSAARALTTRFPPDVTHLLLDAGWHPGRDISGLVDAWARRHAVLADLVFSVAARDLLREFGGLALPQYGGPEEKVIGLGPMSVLHPGDVLFTEGAAFDIPVFPVGISEPVPRGEVNEQPAELVLDPAANLYLLHPDHQHHVAAGLDAVITALIRRRGWSETLRRTPAEAPEGKPA